MKAAIYNPYLDTLGGGERYTITFAKVLSESGYDVDIEWGESDIKEKLSNRFGLKLPANIKIVETVNRGENYDLCFWVSDGSIPTLRSSKNYIHFQVPFRNVNGNSLINKMKFFRVNKIICNSNFTKTVIDNEYKINSEVLYPPVDTDIFKPKRKLNQICYVGRFSKLTQNKGHEVLIDSFKELVRNDIFKDWKLILAGGSEIGSGNYLNEMKKLSSGFNVEFLESPTIDKLKEVLGESKIFWSASGYGVDEINNPEKTEHFGITLVESMSAGCIPFAYNAGGHKEIISHGEDGFLWSSIDELLNMTKSIFSKDVSLIAMSKNAILSSKRFTYERFKKDVLQIIK